MHVMYVNAEALNVRSEPFVSDGNIIGKMYLMQKVEVLDEGDDGWAACQLNVNGSYKTGFVSRKFLRPPLSSNRDALIGSVNQEYERFQRGLGKEHVQPFASYVGEMWAAIGLPHLDGTDTDQPWSAAAISFMVRNSGPAYKNFKFAAGHSKFVHHAIKARQNKDATVPFWGYRLHEARPEVGDIVARDNPSFAPAVDYDVAASLDTYRSHTDIVVKIDSANQRLLAVGGNVGNSVSLAVYDLAPGDFLASTKHTFAILKNITDSDVAMS